MAVAPLRRRAGRIEIENKERKIKEEIKSSKENTKEEKISEEEHQSRLDKLKEIGLLK